VCNKARDLAHLFERPRAEQAMQRGASVDLAVATDDVAQLIASARNPVALVSSWGSNEELTAFHTAFGARMRAFVKSDHLPLPGEVIEDHLLIKADKNPNRRAALALFPALPENVAQALTPDVDVVLVWGEGFDSAHVPTGAKVIRLAAYQHPDNARADVFVPISIQTERGGHYTNVDGVVTAFSACFPVKPSIAHAAQLFATIDATLAAPADPITVRRG
jgi:NADH-quinone oxidoreductase subunit G